MYVINEPKFVLPLSFIFFHGFAVHMCMNDHDMEKKLPVSPFTVLSNIGLQLCFKECEAYAICLSINFDRTQFTCELNSHKRNESLELVDDDDFIYKEISGILDYRDKRCADSPCNKISKCVHTTLNRHVCIAVGCDDVIPDLEDGVIANKMFSPPSVTFQCNSGYSGSGGSNTITCPPAGKWSTLSYQCGLAGTDRGMSVCNTNT